ncbi:MAG TPA: bifunctional DNA-formamidopyrimidine glycosylase/DNA-(apurinic or apyrimidinic site) lyase [Hypericibacter adhaerens]|uniref:bifunctional DNA-formamidopyrimidine glycosylase/DNA-(apurinic or apyrimidinic site) lyase n=1 Tax=Hypericibacter adhaerens TaxID=2602016 RepID=UPI00124508AB|nr:bifunctional DNA-formamidopyrimidine glycosylase/DNA-(apurinic or apyrimidinic site) lyase [Hypericibacter adhaerens]HWA44494.1 bifunctional DNA-formamidopyrimidine glycosylase/DNA-(apurinic or apyrimidinic site) lyase [Hypericibacter adhaerens]
MPELPEVETVCRGLALRLEGRRLARVQQRRKDLRFPLPRGFAARLQGRRVLKVDRRAKYILIHLEGDEILLCHLGMSGRMLIGNGPVLEPEAHDHIILETDDGGHVRFNDARRFGMMDLVSEAGLARHKLIKGLGPEPLDPAFTGAVLATRLDRKATSIKAAILDQRVVAGIGNIYASEALFRAGLSPKRKAGTVQGPRAEKLVAAIKAVLAEAIAAGGSSLRDYVQTDGELGYFQHRWAVYEHEGEACPACECDIAVTGGIRRMTQGGRSTFYCPRRQR